MSNDKNTNQENEHGKHVLHFTINEQKHEWHQQYITLDELKQLGNIPKEDEVFLAVKKPWEDELLKEDIPVDLARPETEHFYSKDKHFKVVLIVNGRQKPWTEKTISFEQVVVLAFGTYDPNPDKVYTVTYDRGPHENPDGTMVKGDIVCVKDKMIFNATATDKS